MQIVVDALSPIAIYIGNVRVKQNIDALERQYSNIMENPGKFAQVSAQNSISTTLTARFVLWGGFRYRYRYPARNVSTGSDAC